MPQRRAVLTVLSQKCAIVAQGALKRQHQARWAYYHAKDLQYRRHLACVGSAASRTS
jgi:hypothetical protein